MIRVTITPKARENIYGLLVKQELSLRNRNRGTLHRSGPKKKDEDKWTHATYPGWIRLQRCLGNTVVVIVQSRDEDAEWQLLTSFVGFLDRNFRKSISSINISYESEADA
jgi:hypothetical protein